MAEEIITTDFLIIGGGLVGLMAALSAKRKGNMDVAIMEKATIEYGGDCIGLDHHVVEHPGIIEHPVSRDFSKEQAAKGEFGVKRLHNLTSLSLAVAEAKNYVKPLALMEEIGVQLREDDGTVKLVQTQKVKGGPTWNRIVKDPEGKTTGDKILYRGADLKQKLANAVHKSGARVFNRTMLTNLIVKDNTVVGAMALNIRSGKLLVFKAKTVLIATGGMSRMYTYPYAPFPNNLFYARNFAGNHGGGVAAAYRAGAKLANMEFVHVYPIVAGALATGAAGGGMYWKMMNSKGEFLEEKYKDKSLKDVGGAFPGTNYTYSPSITAPEIERDVITYETTNATDDEIAACYFTAANEAPRTLKMFKLRGDIRWGPIEMRSFIIGPLTAASGIALVNDRAETSIKNLFAAGSTACATGSSGSKAVVWGYMVGEYARKITAEMSDPVFEVDQVQQVEEERKRVFAPFVNKGIVNPLELEDYVRTANNNYIGIHKIGPRLKRAVEIMQIAKEMGVPSLGASSYHELMRCLEIQDIIELSELHAQSAFYRDESRMLPSHFRLDYPEADNKKWENMILTIQKMGGETKYTREKVE
jgi:succinate dehydrogenase/fumarate reductase flavoprotein subunit